ncbi:Rrf2 family transcriptional regulator [Geobacillus subterraneus]|uniref:HTH-type transcriptional regulator NsrR n=2 Tax=Geobacillus TaxID=129337 RepID=A0ABM6ABE9_9BACL|nr:MULTISPECIES: nitric oxide-sensing transcriptional repressor NsrR [Geobacillus]WJQ01862.1 nitric oxide-sensing transcriptional repressor NsrR [Geobacillus stearothermophilus]AMX83588.1 Rrf2 family transcriptional regulator [Geobacillus subterraneus]KZS25055.1 Rrf2 family transcriptional regulator [Geobacillus subterraneus]OXB87821.1 Rrf2 family transcriptional regulator [Geobacillus uzenensis]QIZ67785.1 nitric oxide-sensing transcriptional repressor NsrR [Geobacillus subterraneus]
MQLTNYTEYALRVLLFLGTLEEGEKTNIKEISTAFSLSEHHLSKIVHELGKLGYIETIRGRNGGIRLAKRPEEIVIGAVVRETEDNLSLVECFAAHGNECVLTPACRLRFALREALEAFLRVLDAYTLADLLENRTSLRILLGERRNR